MNETNKIQNTIVRNDRGLAVSGTRITLYDIMDYVTEGWPPSLIQYWFNLTEEQIVDIMDYINSNRSEVEAEYQVIIQQAEEIRQYWEKRNQNHFAKIATMPRKPGKEKLWAKLEAQKARTEN